MALIGQLKRGLSDLKEEQARTENMLAFCRKLRKGCLVYSEHHTIEVAKNGVRGGIRSFKPALLQYKDWLPKGYTVTLAFNVLASEDPEPYSPPYQLEYTGDAEIEWLEKSHRIVQPQDLPLYVHFKFKTKLFEQLLKKGV